VRYSIVLVMLVCLPCWTQTTATGNASTSQPCSVANTGNGNKIQINCGIGKEQGEKVLAILNKIVANHLDPNAVMAKLDEILKPSIQMWRPRFICATAYGAPLDRDLPPMDSPR
jgi:hypothetical protein